MASYATFVLRQPEPAEAEEYSLEAFRELYPLTGQYAAGEARQRQRRAAQDEEAVEKEPPAAAD